MNYIIKGNTGWKVKVLQTLLGIECTGEFDDKTLEAVRNFQAENNLVQDGIVGEKTFAKLAHLVYPKRWINGIILHCSATKVGLDYDAKTIDRWHRQRGWSGIGYHYVIKLDGTVEVGRSIDQNGAHCEGKNSGTIGICYIGGYDSNGKPSDTRTPEQKEALKLLVLQLMILNVLKPCNIHCHNEYSNKACPCFKIDTFRRELEEYGCR